ncbi:hypothetical protein MAR_024154 [Mya arenaria]|uniref:Uncharacterized protein n=1 Tax=Mya arenaria TaxID=6604 RepID=A0ABY7DPY8_MYAAR|nr:hypothetical protein MAR_024154 [Mya arenaria]
MKMHKFGGNSDVHYDSLQYDNEPVDNNSPDSDSAELVSSSYSFNSRCYCGEAQGHEWAPTSQWMPPLSLTSEPDAEVPLESDIDLYDSQTGSQSIYSSPVHQEASTNGLHSDIPYSVPPKKHPNNQVLKIKRFVEADVLKLFDLRMKTRDSAENGKYSCELRTCIYSLLGLYIAASNVSSVRNTVLNLVGKTVEKLPSRTTILNMNIERLVLSQKQLNETLPNKDNMTLYTDETTKFGTKYSGYHVSDTEGNTYVLGMREIVTKSGSDTLNNLSANTQ